MAKSQWPREKQSRGSKIGQILDRMMIAWTIAVISKRQTSELCCVRVLKAQLLQTNRITTKHHYVIGASKILI